MDVWRFLMINALHFFLSRQFFAPQSAHYRRKIGKHPNKTQTCAFNLHYLHFFTFLNSLHVFVCPSQVGYEFLFPIHSPLITRIQVLKRGFIGRNKNACAGIRLVPVRRHSLRHIAFTICIFCIFVLPICEKNVWKTRKFEKNICLWYTLHATCDFHCDFGRYFMRAMVGKRNVIPIDKVNGQLPWAENRMNFTYHHFMFNIKEWRVFKL